MAGPGIPSRSPMAITHFPLNSVISILLTFIGIGIGIGIGISSQDK